VAGWGGNGAWGEGGDQQQARGASHRPPTLSSSPPCCPVLPLGAKCRAIIIQGAAASGGRSSLQLPSAVPLIADTQDELLPLDRQRSASQAAASGSGESLMLPGRRPGSVLAALLDAGQPRKLSHLAPPGGPGAGGGPWYDMDLPASPLATATVTLADGRTLQQAAGGARALHSGERLGGTGREAG